jgi:nicotinamidase-related amidase
VPIDPTRTAVVLIEYQNDFTSDGGVLHDAVRPVMDRTGMLENTGKLVEAARAAGATIVLSDCLAATSDEEHENAIRFDYPMFSEVMTSEGFTNELQGAPAPSA